MATSIDKKTAALMVKRLQRKLDNLFEEQQSLNGNKGTETMRKGGLVKAAGGFENPDYSPGRADISNLQRRHGLVGAPNPWALVTPNPAMMAIPDELKYNADLYIAAEDARALTPATTSTTGSPFSFNNYGIKGNNKVSTPGNPSGPINMGTIAQLAPAIYNFAKGLQKPEVAKPNYNPYESQIRSTMANRRFNVNPLLNANLTAQAVNNRNIRNTANSRGELMSNLGAAQNMRMVGDAAAYTQKSNMDNQYLAEQAQADMSLGSNRASMDSYTQEANAKNRAATNQFMGQSMNDVANFAQMQQLMAGQQRADQQRGGLYNDMFSVSKYMPGIQEILQYLQTIKGGVA